MAVGWNPTVATTIVKPELIIVIDADAADRNESGSLNIKKD